MLRGRSATVTTTTGEHRECEQRSPRRDGHGQGLQPQELLQVSVGFSDPAHVASQRLSPHSMSVPSQESTVALHATEQGPSAEQLICVR